MTETHFTVHLLRDFVILSPELNNPLNDALKAERLFYDEVNGFFELSPERKQIYCCLLYQFEEFKGFFEYVGFLPYKSNVEQLIASEFSGSDDCYSITPRWLSKNYPKIENVIKFMCNTPCEAGCSYCSEVQKFLAISHTAILSPVNVTICEES